MKWISDPNTSKPSVTLTLMVVAFVALVVAAGLEMAGVVKSTSILLEMYIGNLSVYLGRRISFKGNTYDASPSGEPK